jgi:carboxypeptidase Taq
MDAYSYLEQTFRTAAAFREANAILGWDLQTMMPAGAAESRGVQMAALEVAAHERVAAPEVAGALADAVRDQRLDEWQRANVREMRRAHLHAAAVDPTLVERLSRAGARCTMVWRAARPRDDFGAWADPQQEVLELVREVARQKAAAFGCSPYDALIDQYEPGMSAVRIEAIFAPLRQELPALTDEVLARQESEPEAIPLGDAFDPNAQQALGRRVMEALGFDFERGRLDTSAHPFCGGATDDVRVTTRYRTDEFLSSMMGIVHETGHALYEQALPAEWARLPVGSARGMALHESQSLLLEMQVGRGDAFLSFLAPLVREAFGVSGPAFSVENLARHVRHVERGLIRVDADEVTYPTHILLRFALEQDLIEGALQIRDVPGRWRELMRALVGVENPDDRNGCMQDIHWTDGAFGYFPSYTLGALCAAQLFASVRSAIPGLDEQIRAGEFSPLRAWLGAHVHGRGSSLTTDELMERATGAPLSAAPFLSHLRHRYLPS